MGYGATFGILGGGGMAPLPPPPPNPPMGPRPKTPSFVVFSSKIQHERQINC